MTSTPSTSAPSTPPATPTPPKPFRKVPPPPKAWAMPAPLEPNSQTHFQQWLAHVEAGRIGAHLCSNASLFENGKRPCPPEVAKRREANERLFARLAGRE